MHIDGFTAPPASNGRPTVLDFSSTEEEKCPRQLAHVQRLVIARETLPLWRIEPPVAVA